MKLLADENVPLAAVAALRASGIDVTWIGDIRAGMPDDDVLAVARTEKRVVLTLDRDFGELVFLRRQPPPPAIILIRAPIDDPVLELAIPVNDLIAREEIAGFFWVMGRENWRRHPLPKG